MHGIFLSREVFVSWFQRAGVKKIGFDEELWDVFWPFFDVRKSGSSLSSIQLAEKSWKISRCIFSTCRPFWWFISWKWKLKWAKHLCKMPRGRCAIFFSSEPMGCDGDDRLVAVPQVVKYLKSCVFFHAFERCLGKIGDLTNCNVQFRFTAGTAPAVSRCHCSNRIGFQIINHQTPKHQL